ncbi:MAG: lysophospholipid acyltransferase family protein [Candidatus Omnitrophica bacterium]|nr:lysophospholipid acyltransferase family protein [Candidatus Omnitrophota bacterium]
MIYEICKAICYFVIRFFAKIEVSGRETFPKKGPFILASNHISNFDPEVVGMLCPRQLYYLAKEELFKSKALSAVLRKIKVVPLKRGTGDVHALRLGLKVLEKEPLLIFPQGTRSANYDSIKEGVGFLYKKSGAPIIAAKVYGTDKILPKGAKFPKFGKIKVIYAKVEGLSETDSREEISAKVVETIKNL